MKTIWKRIKKTVRRFWREHKSQILCFAAGLLIGLVFLRIGQTRQEAKLLTETETILIGKSFKLYKYKDGYLIDIRKPLGEEGEDD